MLNYKANSTKTLYTLRLRSILELMLRGWVAFILILGFVGYLQNTQIPLLTKLISLILSLVMIGVSYHLLVKSYLNESQWDRLGVLIFGFSTIATFLWVWKFDSVQVSDFGVYFRCGAESSMDKNKWIDNCQSKYLHKNLIYWGRSLLYTTPLEYFTGMNYPILKFYNAVLHTATIALWYFGLRRYYDSRISTTATFFLILYPEWWFTTTLATTDNAALFMIIALTLLLPKLQQAAFSTLIIIGLSLILFAANMLRTIGPLLMLVVVLWSFLTLLMQWQPFLAWRIFLVLLLYSFCNSLIGSFTPSRASDPLQFLKSLSSIDFGSTQDFGNNYSWGEHFWFAIPTEFRAQVAYEKIYLEIVNGFYQWPIYLYQKSLTLFDGSGYYGLSSYPFNEFNPDTVLNVPASTVPFSPAFSAWLAVPISIYLTLAAWTLFRVRLNGPGFLSAIWLGIFSLIILGLSETQPRYSVLIAPALSLLSAIAFFRREKEHLTKKPFRVENIMTRNTCLGFLFITALFGIVSLGLHIVKSQNTNPMLLAAKTPYNANEHLIKCNQNSVKLESTYKQLRIVMPKGAECASIELPLSKETRDISFFVSGSNFPYLWESSLRSPYHYKVEINGRSFLDASLNEHSVRWHRIELFNFAAGEPAIVRFQIDRTDVDKENSITISLFTERSKK